jgi:hypothetical protein
MTTVMLTEGQAHALCGLLDHKQQTISGNTHAGFAARHLAARYEALRVDIGGRRARRGHISIAFARRDARSLEILLEHEVRTHGNEHYAAALAAFRVARQPKPDPRRPNGRRVPQAVA